MKNFTTYFNTYYNQDRLMKECEEQFEYSDALLRLKPRILAPTPKKYIPNNTSGGTPNFLEDFIVKQQKRQPVSVKLDSIIIKGSKILSYSAKSDYIEGAIFLMAKSYFYREEWLNSEVKCSELIDKFPAGELSPDAHLLFAKSLLIERKFFQGKTLLSRTVDICWMLKRYDILGEAFRLQAELALYENDIDGALRPYLQAIAQTDDPELRAKWQLDLAALYYRVGNFNKSAIAFTKVHKYSPDYLGSFEAYLYTAASLNRIGKYKEADEILEKIEFDGKYKEWRGYVFAEKMNGFRIKKDSTKLDSLEKYCDTAFASNALIAVVNFERAMDLYDSSKFIPATKYFAKSRMQKTPVFQTSSDMFKLLTEFNQKSIQLEPNYSKFKMGEKQTDTNNFYTSILLYDLGRIHEQLGNTDSAKIYYYQASEVCPENNGLRAKYLYNYCRFIKTKEPEKFDSLFEIIATKYSKTDHGREVGKILRFTEKFDVDSASELFTSGTQLRIYGDYIFANMQYLRIFNEYPKHYLAPKSLYSIGWIFENKLFNYDSAYYYYDLLVSKYPNSDYARDVKVTLYTFDLSRRGGELPDSLKPKTIPISTVNINTVLDDAQKVNFDRIKPIEESKGIMDYINNPNKILDQIKNKATDMINKPKDAFNNALDSAKNFKMPEVPKFPNMPGSGGNPNPNGINSNNGLQPIPTPMPSDTLKK